jgi:TorA maturation chaperone TorD
MTGATLRSEDALAAAADWRLLGLLLERPRSESLAEIRALAAATRDPALREAAAGIATVCEGEYLALLGPGGLASPREAAYVGMQDPGWTLAEIARFYDVFAFAPRTEDPPDHVTVEVAFVAYLHLKEAFALETDDAEAAETTRIARTRFVAEHLARIARPMADRLAPALGTPLVRAALLLAARVPPLPAGTMVAPHDDDGPATCGACGTVGRF